jgi:hypothetical protein
VYGGIDLSKLEDGGYLIAVFAQITKALAYEADMIQGDEREVYDVPTMTRTSRFGGLREN